MLFICKVITILSIKDICRANRKLKPLINELTQLINN